MYKINEQSRIDLETGEKVTCYVQMKGVNSI